MQDTSYTKSGNEAIEPASSIIDALHEISDLVIIEGPEEKQPARHWYDQLIFEPGYREEVSRQRTSSTDAAGRIFQRDPLLRLALGVGAGESLNPIERLRWTTVILAARGLEPHHVANVLWWRPDLLGKGKAPREHRVGELLVEGYRLVASAQEAISRRSQS